MRLKHFAKMSNYAYWNRLGDKAKTNIRETLKGQGYEKVMFIDKKKPDTQYIVAYNKKEVVIAVRGTTSKDDVLTDAKFIKTKFDKGRAHRGFLKAYRSISKDVFDLLRQIDPIPAKEIDEYKDIYVCGHSLGGAVATIMAYEIAKNYRPVKALYTYGSPRVFNHKMANRFNALAKKGRIENVFRVRYQDDAVSRIPPLTFGYKHVAGLIYIDNKGKVRSKTPNKYVLKDSAKEILQYFKGSSYIKGILKNAIDSGKDHSLDNYIRSC